MTHHTITDLEPITSELDPTGAIESYLWEELTDGSHWSSVEEIARQLETASCANGSWSGLIYTRDIYEKLSDPQWQDDIDQALADFSDATGETPDLSTLGEMVTFAVDFVAGELASKLRSLGKVAVVTVSQDSLDPSPMVIAFASESTACDWVADEVERRVDHMVQHSLHCVSEAEREMWSEEEASLFHINMEVL